MYINFVCVLKVNIRHTDGQTITNIPNDRQTVTHTHKQTMQTNRQSYADRPTSKHTHTSTDRQCGGLPRRSRWPLCKLRDRWEVSGCPPRTSFCWCSQTVDTVVAERTQRMQVSQNTEVIEFFGRNSKWFLKIERMEKILYRRYYLHTLFLEYRYSLYPNKS